MNRRSFIQKSTLLTSTVFISLKSFPSSLFSVDGLVSGTVTSRGKAVAGVVISDGYSVVQTDKIGNYQIQLHELARFVWISTPSGYEFKTESSIARHYYKPDSAGKLNFDLKPLKQDDNKHNFIIWADPQVKNKKDVQQMMETSVPDTRDVVKGMGKTLVHGIGVGDLVWDNFDLFPAYDEAIAKIGIPFFQALGNHDQDYRQGGDDTSDRTFQAHYGPTYYSFNRGKAHYVVLDDVRYLGVERTYDGYITPTQLEWLAKDLQLVPKDAGTNLKWYYKSTGRDRKEQLDIYVDTLTNQKRLIANVWNYDPDWKIEYFLDGKAMGVLAQQDGFDPLAIRLYKGDKLPNPRPFVEPRSTDHLFMAHFEPSVKKVKVVATDRFGEKFEAEINA
jgi:hypothetical protein